MQVNFRCCILSYNTHYPGKLSSIDYIRFNYVLSNESRNSIEAEQEHTFRIIDSFDNVQQCVLTCLTKLVRSLKSNLNNLTSATYRQWWHVKVCCRNAVLAPPQRRRRFVKVIYSMRNDNLAIFLPKVNIYKRDYKHRLYVQQRSSTQTLIVTVRSIQCRLKLRKFH